MAHVSFLFGVLTAILPTFPTHVDLRNIESHSWVSTVKSQQGGTCWTHAAMASIESNLMVTGAWTEAAESGEPNLAEYHLDWWNGFNQYNNPDIASTQGGLTVHNGGDYRVAAAYLSRGVGSVRDVDGQSYNPAPTMTAAGFHHFLVRDIEWLTDADRTASITRIKAALLDSGAVGTALAWGDAFYSSPFNSFYQPDSSAAAPNHAVTIVGWDDNRVTQAPTPGAWLVKNSWGSAWGNQGYFWISYADKVAGHHHDMGGVAFKNVVPNSFSHIYNYDTHGWRDTHSSTRAFNAFKAEALEELRAVSFYTTATDTNATITVYQEFDGQKLFNAFTTVSRHYDNPGLHTADLDRPILLQAQTPFYVEISVNRGGQAYDKTSVVPVLLGGSARPLVESRALAGQSYFHDGQRFRDLTKADGTANFCIKALTVR
ncbi:MAG: hypothetical protein HYR96_12610 [Deltaproteobacteria bacterium]|nr:hypothetical protein [Deltaproteobacteria bacterium]MBI3293379.1 hypothetical protein [Deltaproteobacteria bacterium]